MGIGITEFIKEEFEINEAKLKEVSQDNVLKILKDFDFKKGRDFTVSGKNIYLTSNEVAMEVSDELVDDYTVTYDDEDNFKLSIFA